ncbi:MAG: hypothetical protein U5R06_03715 [candidate division KSB1 bacterium]|nr:hypothetical protein [candidate division KSB1 bacterium]
MADITLEKTHALLQQLAEYVMTQVPTKQEMNEKLELKADKTDVQRIDNNVKLLLEGMDAQSKQLETLSIDMKAVSRTLDIHEQRLAMLEERVFGARVREDQEHYKDKNSKKA